MNKFLFYTLILITLLGIFSPVTKIEAAGQCWRIDQGAPMPGISKGDCLKMCQPAVPAAQCRWEEGWCWKDGDEISTDTFANTPPACTGQLGKWQKDGEPKPPPPDGPDCAFPEILKDGRCQTCSFPQVPKDGNACVSCESGKVPENNVCVPCPTDTKEIVNNKCVIKCTPPATRNLTTGICFTQYTAPTPPDTSYTLLAPLPCDPNKVGPSCAKDEKGNYVLKTFDPASSDKDGKNIALGAYLNMMIQLFLGICSVLAVIMIVMGGVEYMTSELISSKEAGKERITHAIFGLLLAFGAWTLLNTINPNILFTDLESLKPVTLVNEGETPASAVGVDSGPIPTGPTPSCASGLQRTTSGIVVCKNIANNIDALVVAARGANLTLTGGGHRSSERQKQLRIQNCSGNFTDQNATCNPPTALPGLSRHQNGLAIDFYCSGTLIQTHDNACFKWLKANANSYGLANMGLEPWHWSTDGR